MRLGRLRALAGLLMVVTMLAGGLWQPVSAQNETQPGATPDVVSGDTNEGAAEPTAAATEMPAAAPARLAPQQIDAAVAEGTVTFTIITADGGELPASMKLCMWDPVNGTRCSDAAASTWTVTVPEGEFDYWTDLQDPYLEVDVYGVAIAAGESLAIDVVLEQAEMVDVTFTVSTVDGGAVPADLEICISDAVNIVECSGMGVTTWTIPVLSQGFDYWTQFSDPYLDADVEGVTLPAGEPATIEIVLETRPELFTNITKEVSNQNPAPGSEVTYTVHAWGISPYSAVSIEDFLPDELTDATFSCEIAIGAPEWTDSCDDWWMPDVGFVYGGVDPDPQGDYDVTFTVTATVPDEPGVQFTNTACAYGERGELRAAAAAAPITGSECAAASVLTGAEALPASVTVNVTTPDASPIPAGTAICVTSAGDVQPVCSADGAASWTFPVVAGEIEYTVLAPGYDLVFGYDEVPAGEERVIDVVLEPAVESGMNITKTVSDPNPLPGAEVEYEIHVWGSTPSMEEITFVDVLPAELSDVRVECELIEGFPISPSCAYPVDGYIVGTIVPDDYNDDSDVYEMVVTVTGTVTSEPNVEFTNLACVSTSPERLAVASERTGILAFAQPMVPVGACAAATVLTQNLPVPGAWGDATKTVDVEEAQPGDAVTYTVTLPWTAGDEGAVGEATFSLADSVPDRVTDIAWTCGGENVTCDVASGSESYVTVTGSVDDPEADALVVLTITGVVAADADAGQVVNQACSNSEVMPPDQVIPVLSFAAQQPGCQSMPAAVFYVVLDPGTPTPTPSPTEPAPDVTPTATATASATATPANDARPTVTTLPNTGATPADSDLPLGPAALVAAMFFAAGAVVTRGARAKR